jgi:hypothetical protein
VLATIQGIPTCAAKSPGQLPEAAEVVLTVQGSFDCVTASRCEAALRSG